MGELPMKVLLVDDESYMTEYLKKLVDWKSYGFEEVLTASGGSIARDLIEQKKPELLVTDGCIYVSANIKEPGVLLQHGKILRIVFGVREKTDWRPELEEIRQDFTDSAIDGILSENIRREACKVGFFRGISEE